MTQHIRQSSRYPSGFIVCGISWKSTCMAMTQRMTFIPVKIIRKVCIATTLVIFLVVLHFNSGTNKKNEGFEWMKKKSPIFTTRLNESFLMPTHSKYGHRSSYSSQPNQQLLPSPFRLIDGATVSEVNSFSYDNNSNIIVINNSKNKYNNNKNNKLYAAFNCTVSKCDPSFPICIYKTSQDRFISGALLSSGVWEPFITSAFQTALENHPDATVVDIGANIGYYSLLALSRNHDVIAVEPGKENQRRLVAGSLLTKRQYKEAGNVLLLGNAMSDGHRFVSLSRSQDNQGALRVLEGCLNRNNGILGFLVNLYGSSSSETGGNDLRYTHDNTNSHARPCDIPTLTMNDLLMVVNAKKVVVKMDVEGYECRAMGQSTLFLTTLQVPYIFTEWRLMRERQYDRDTACTSRSIRRLSSTLSDLGYVPHEVQSGIRLNPYNSPQWHVGDVYWRKNDQPLLVPSM